MTTNISRLASLIDLGRPHQQAVVHWALDRLLNANQCGVVLADEVGCGKTYEALALLALLWRHYRQTNRPIRRVLILCKSNLVRKWHEELTAHEKNGDKHGLRSYLPGEEWQPVVQKFVDGLVMVENLYQAERMWRGTRGQPYFKGVRKGGKLQAPEGLYLVNQQLLYATRRDNCKLLKYLYRTDWDLVIVDEAHHYGKGNKCDSIFATSYRPLGRGDRPDFGAKGTLAYRHLLLLTATPFELEPNELLNLLQIAGTGEADLESLKDLLNQYQQGLSTFFGLRALPPDNERRRRVVEHLRGLRLGEGNHIGLELLLQRYIVRNFRQEKLPAGKAHLPEAPQPRREYSLVNRIHEQALIRWERHHFDKFDDLKQLCARLPLIPFTGPHALFYLEFRDLIQEAIEQQSPDEAARGTFVAMDLQQGLSSYPQLTARSDPGKPKRLLERGSERAQHLHRLLTEWEKNGVLHPKVQSLTNVVDAIVDFEIERVEKERGAWFAKVVIFNKLVAGTARHLHEQLDKVLQSRLKEALARLAGSSDFGSAKALRKAARRVLRKEVQHAREEFTRTFQMRGERPTLSPALLNEAGFDIAGHKHRHAVDVLVPYFERRVDQPLFLIDFLLSGGRLDENGLLAFIHRNMLDPAISSLDETIDKYLDQQPDPDEAQRLSPAQLYDTGIRGLSQLRESLRTPDLVARYDGETYEFRESNRINFNERWSPLVLIVSRVGEEGIDLQKQARYILHYDLEWNPAKMEQREGRVDREGYGHAGTAIDVRFFLLKGTYEERIFHTVMQRDQWFQILMGNQRRQLGRLTEEDEDQDDSADANMLPDIQNAEYTIGQLTPAEQAAVMIDLRPFISV